MEPSPAQRRPAPWRDASPLALRDATGKQLQIDFGETRVWIGGEQLRVHLFVATLAYSRRLHVRVSLRERQVDWFAGMEEAFPLLGGVPAEILLDNARALVEHHNAAPGRCASTRAF